VQVVTVEHPARLMPTQSPWQPVRTRSRCSLRPIPATCNNTASQSTYHHATATPASVGQTGTRAIATNNSGTIYQNFTGTAIAVTMAATQILQ
jgi:hypothetical protein